MVYRFLSMPTHQQRQIALKLGLWSEEDDWNLVVIFERVRRQGLIDELAAEVGS